MPQPTMGFERYDVLTALSSFLDTPVRKPRPVMVLSSNAFNAANAHVITAMITTSAERRWPSDRPIIDLPAAGLRHPSVIRSKLFMLPYSSVGRWIGHVSAPARTARAAHFEHILHA